MRVYLTPKDYETAERNGIDARNLEQRFYAYGWDVERATTQPIGQRGTLDMEYVRLAAEHGVSRDTFRQRIKKYGWSAEKAATTPPIPREERRKVTNTCRRVRNVSESKAGRTAGHLAEN